MSECVGEPRTGACVFVRLTGVVWVLLIGMLMVLSNCRAVSVVCRVSCIVCQCRLVSRVTSLSLLFATKEIKISLCVVVYVRNKASERR